MIKDTKELLSKEIILELYGSNSEMVRDMEGHCGQYIFNNPDNQDFNNLSHCICDTKIFRTGFFNDFEKKIKVCTVSPKDVGIIESESFHQFALRMKSQYDLKLLPASAFPAVCKNFDPRLFKKPTVLTKVMQAKLSGFWIHSVIVLSTNSVTISPEIRWIQFDVTRDLKIDYNYLFAC